MVTNSNLFEINPVGQISVGFEDNELDDIETLVRLNEQLNTWIHNQDALANSSNTQQSRVESRRAESEEEHGPERERLQHELDELDDQIETAENHVAQFREYRHQVRLRRQKRRQQRSLRRRLRSIRSQSRREQLQNRIVQLGIEITELDEAIDRYTSERTARNEGVVPRRNPMQRLNRLRRIRRRTERRLSQIEADSGQYMVHPGSRNTFTGRRPAEDRQGRRRRGTVQEPRVTGRLDQIRPVPNWGDFIGDRE